MKALKFMKKSYLNLKNILINYSNKKLCRISDVLRLSWMKESRIFSAVRRLADFSTWFSGSANKITFHSFFPNYSQRIGPISTDFVPPAGKAAPGQIWADFDPILKRIFWDKIEKVTGERKCRGFDSFQSFQNTPVGSTQPMIHWSNRPQFSNFPFSFVEYFSI